MEQFFNNKDPKDDSFFSGFSSDDCFALDPDELEKVAGGWNGEFGEYDTVYY